MDILHDHQHQSFLTLLNGESIWISYSKPDPHTMKIEGTYTPRRFSTNEIRNALAEYVLNYAQQNKFHIVVACMFIRKYIDENPQYYALEIRRKTDAA